LRFKVLGEGNCISILNFKHSTFNFKPLTFITIFEVLAFRYSCEKMKKTIIACFAFHFLLSGQCSAQVFGFYRTDSIIVIDNSLSTNDTLTVAWSGGLSHSEFSNIDLDGDGILDLYIFDRVGNRFLLLQNNGIANTISYKNEFTQMSAFPIFNDWGLLMDYNGDGKNDLFHYYNGGISVYKNISIPGTVQFTLIKTLVKSNYVPNTLPLYVSPADIPGIADIDLDGDLDILTYGFSSGCLEYHKNLSQETYGHSDSLIFIKETDNWGLFSEGVSLYDINLGDSCDTGRHSGSTVLAIDMNNDHDKDLIIGDAGGGNLAYLRNGGDSSYAIVDLIDPNFPQNYNSTIPANISIFASAFFLDVNNDNAKDLICSNSAPGSSETSNSIWRYKNIGTTANPDFKFQQNDFLQSEMIELGEGAFPALFDYNRDGLTDLAIGNATYFGTQGQIAVLRNTGTATQPAYELVDYDMGSVSAQGVKNITPTFGDMDNDGDVDMIIGETTGYIHYYQNNAPVSTNTPAQFTLTATQYFNIKENSFSAPFIIDLNQDGLNDIVCGGRLGKLNYYQNTGTASVPNFSSIPTITNLGGVTTVDPSFSSSGYSVPWFFTHNGELELFVGSYSGKVYHYSDIYDGSNNIQTSFNFITGVVAFYKDGVRSAVTVGNLNGDIYPDMIYGNLGGGLDLLYGQFSSIGIEEIANNENEFILYPNPSTENSQVFISSKTGFDLPLDIVVYDLSGRVMKHLKEFNILQSIDVHGLSSGLYIFELRYKNSLVSKLKFIKQ